MTSAVGSRGRCCCLVMVGHGGWWKTSEVICRRTRGSKITLQGILNNIIRSEPYGTGHTLTKHGHETGASGHQRNGELPSRKWISGDPREPIDAPPRHVLLYVISVAIGRFMQIISSFLTSLRMLDCGCGLFHLASVFQHQTLPHPAVCCALDYQYASF